MSEPNETRSFEDVYRVQTSEIERLSGDLATARLNASAAVKLAQDREKECQRLRWENDRLRECVAGQERRLQEARQRIGELESQIETAFRPCESGHGIQTECYGCERDALKAELESITRKLYTEAKRLDFSSKGIERDEQELASLRTGSAQLAEDLDACKRERDEAKQRAQMWHDRRKASEIERDSLQQQLAEKSAICERLKVGLSKARALILRHHDSSFICRPGCFCPVCSPDGDDVPFNEAFELIQRTEGKE